MCRIGSGNTNAFIQADEVRRLNEIKKSKDTSPEGPVSDAPKTDTDSATKTKIAPQDTNTTKLVEDGGENKKIEFKLKPKDPNSSQDSQPKEKSGTTVGENK